MPTVTEGSEGEARVSVDAATVIVNAVDVDCSGLPLSFTDAVKVATPPVVGKPEITPVADARVRPAGSAPEVMDHVYGAVPPVARSVCE